MITLGMGIGLASSANAGVAWSPATRSLTGWWRAPYVAAPMVGVASAGTSSAENLAVNADADATPSADAAVNGYAPAKFDNAIGQSLETVHAMSTFVASGVGTIVMLVKVPSASATAGVYNDLPFVYDRNSVLALTFSSSGVGAGVYDGSQKTRVLACTTAAWHLIAMRWDGATLKLRVDSTDATPTAAGAVPTLTGRIVFGKLPGVAFAKYSMLEAAIEATAVTDGVLDSWKAYFNSRYALSLT